MSEVSFMVKILEVGVCCAGIPETFADALDTEHLKFSDNPFGYQANKQIRLIKKRGYITDRIPNVIRKHWKSAHDFENSITYFHDYLDIINKYDILHLHFGSVLPLGLDMKHYKDIETYIHLHGNDIRGKPNRMKYYKDAERIFVSTPDLINHTMDIGELCLNPFDINKYPEVGINGDNKTLYIVHAPSTPSKKGTENIKHAFKTIERIYSNVKTEVITNKKHKEIIEAFKNADIVVDWANMNYGIYGVTSLEAMSLGKPVICTINEEYDKYYPGCPIYKLRNDDVRSIIRAIDTLIENPDMRVELGKMGREYVRNVHNIDTIIQQVFGKAYEQEQVRIKREEEEEEEEEALLKVEEEESKVDDELEELIIEFSKCDTETSTEGEIDK